MSDENDVPVTNESEPRPSTARFPEAQQIWLRRVIRDGFGIVAKYPFLVVIAALIPLIVDVIYPPDMMDDLLLPYLELSNDWSLIESSLSQVFGYSVLAILTSLISHSLVFVWANSARLKKRYSIRDFTLSFSALPRLAAVLLFEVFCILGLILATTPFLFLSYVSKIFVAVWMISVGIALLFYLIKWQPKFDYLWAGSVITREPLSVLIGEWWNMPDWLWRRFLVLFTMRIGFAILAKIIIFPIVLVMTSAGLIDLAGAMIQHFVIGAVMLLAIVMNAIGFVRGRDEWAELTDTDAQNEAKDVKHEWIA